LPKVREALKMIACESKSKKKIEEELKELEELYNRLVIKKSGIVLPLL